jgi:SAM-dependent MidA family methyltransferase
VRLVGVEQRPRPAELPDRVEWRPDLPPRVSGLLIAFEWLDTVPVDVVVNGRVLMVGPDGQECTGRSPDRRTRDWLNRWWPHGARREAGHRRDDAWADAVGRLETGLAVTVDYGHVAADRPPAGSLVGFRRGRRVAPVPDADTDVTAHVAFDAVADAVRRAVPEAHSVLRPQAEVLPSLGVTAALPPRRLVDGDALRRTGQARLLLAPSGLGGFSWLMTAVGVPGSVLPVAAARLSR